MPSHNPLHGIGIEQKQRCARGRAEYRAISRSAKIRLRPGPTGAARADGEEPLSTGALIGIGVFLVVLVISGVWLMNTLRDIGKMQDCAMQGRRNCAPIESPPRDR